MGKEGQVAGVRFQPNELDVGHTRIREVGEALFVHKAADTPLDVKPGMEISPLAMAPLVSLVRTS